MSTNVTLHAGHDVAYFTSGQGRGGCAGAMSYYTAAGEPPGQWAGKGAAALGLSGQADPKTIERLYQENIGPGGELLVKRRHLGCQPLRRRANRRKIGIRELQPALEVTSQPLAALTLCCELICLLVKNTHINQEVPVKVR